LFASSSAQRNEGGRVRDKDVADVAAAYEAYNAGFGGDDAYGGFYDAFADAFGDAGAYGDYGYDAADEATAAPAAVDAGRPVEVVEEDDTKTAIVDGLTAAVADPGNNAFKQKCFVGVGTSATTWFDNAGNSWQNCNGGEYNACEIKVVRNSDNEITQIVSKCANEQSCVDNMVQNFNPQLTSTFNVYDSYANQQCRPQNIGGISAASFSARFKKNDSVCFFCIEPCSLETPETSDQTALQTAQCVGKGSAANSKPVSGNANLDLLTQASDSGLDQTVYTGPSTPAVANNAKDVNWYSTVLVDLTDGNGINQRAVVSRIQYNQLEITNAANVALV